MDELKGVKTVGELVSRVDSNQALEQMIKDKPSDVLRAADLEIRENAEVPNTFVYRAAVVFVGLALLITIIGAFILLGFENAGEAPEWVVAVTSAAIGALAGMLRA